MDGVLVPNNRRPSAVPATYSTACLSWLGLRTSGTAAHVNADSRASRQTAASGFGGKRNARVPLEKSTRSSSCSVEALSCALADLGPPRWRRKAANNISTSITPPVASAATQGWSASCSARQTKRTGQRVSRWWGVVLGTQSYWRRPAGWRLSAAEQARRSPVGAVV